MNIRHVFGILVKQDFFFLCRKKPSFISTLTVIKS